MGKSLTYVFKIAHFILITSEAQIFYLFRLEAILSRISHLLVTNIMKG
jgi:hypothetical protein